MTADSGLFPRFRLKVSGDEVPVEVLERRARFAAGPLGKRLLRGDTGAADAANYRLPDKSASLSPEAFGREMFRLHGRAWPLMITLASGAAMRAERDAIAAADKVEGRG